MKICQKCKTEGFSHHNHHITYKPEKRTYLCPYCHALITAINSSYCAWNEKKKLSNRTRLKLFKYFLETDVTILEALLNRRKNRKITKQSRKLASIKKFDKNKPKNKLKGINTSMWREQKEMQKHLKSIQIPKVK